MLIDIFLGPFVWILVGIAIDLLLWIVLALGGVIAWLALGRPWQLVVLDGDGATLAIGKVKGRRAAHELASSAQARLAAGLDPATAISTP